MNLLELYRQIRFGFLVAFIITAPALITAGFKVMEVPYVHFYDENGTISLNGIVIFAEPFYMFLVQKANVFLTYFPLSFIGGLWMARLLKPKSKEVLLRGLKKVPVNEMAKAIKKLAIAQAKRFGYTPAYRIQLGGIPVPYSSETQNFLFLGGAGGGKTQALFSLTEQIKDFGETIVFFDRKPEFFQKYYRDKKDLLFFPKDKRSINFNLLEQIKSESISEDVKFIASSIIPLGNAKDVHWNDSARKVLSAVLFTLYHNTDRTNKSLSEFLQKNQGAIELRDALLKYNTADFYGIDVKSTLTDDTQGASVYSTLNRFLDSLKDSTFISDQKPFSIRDFVWSSEYVNQDIRLFVVQTTNEQELYSDWYRVFFSLLSREIRSLPSRLDRRFWIIVDEFQTLGKMPELVEELPAEGRSKGACLLLATQTIPKIEDIYGRNLTQSTLGNTKTKVIFGTYDTDGRKMLEEYFGKVEIEEKKESYSQGGSFESNRINTSTNIATRSAVMGSELLELPLLNAYVQMFNYVSRVEFSFLDIPDVSSFQPKPLREYNEAYTNIDVEPLAISPTLIQQDSEKEYSFDYI